MQLTLLHNFPLRPPLRYFGGKWSIAGWIIQAIQRHYPHHSIYVEAYGGGYGIGLQKMSVGIEVYNDLNPLIVNFWQCLRDQPEKLINLIKESDRSLEEYNLCRQTCLDPIEQARRTYILSKLSYCGVGTRWISGTTRDRQSRPDAQDDSMLWPAAERIKSVFIQRMDAIACIEAWDDPHAVFYIDPPYLKSARKSRDSRHRDGAPRRQYAFEISEADHIELGKFLKTIKGGAIVSGYDSPLYDSLFDGWIKLTKSVQGTAGPATEYLWIKQ